MNWKATVVMLVVIIVYVVMGGYIFHAIEGGNETSVRANLTFDFYEFLGKNNIVCLQKYLFVYSIEFLIIRNDLTAKFLFRYVTVQ